MRFLEYGLVDFKPKYSIILKPYKYYQHNTVVCVELSSCELKLGDILYYEKNGRYYQVEIKSLRLDKDVDMISGGEIGIGLSDKIPQKCDLYKK